MAFKASQTKIMSEKKLRKLHASISLTNYIFCACIFAVAYSYPQTSMISLCTDLDQEVHRMMIIMILFTMIAKLSWIGIGIYHDVAMISFLKKRKQIQSLQGKDEVCSYFITFHSILFKFT